MEAVKGEIFGLGVSDSGYVTGDGDELTSVPHGKDWRGRFLACDDGTLRSVFRSAAKSGLRGVAFGSKERGIRSLRLEEGRRHKVSFFNARGWGISAHMPDDVQRQMRECRDWCNATGHAWRPTAASWMLAVWRKEYKHLENGGTISQLPPLFRPLAIRGYQGGPILHSRAESRPSRAWDKKRAYTHAMMRPLPTGRPMRSVHRDWSRLRRQLCMVEATVEVASDLDLPPLPVRLHREGTLIYPVGRFRGVWTSVDLRGMEERGDGVVVRVHDAIVFPAGRVLEPLMGQLADWEDQGFAHAKFAANAFGGKWAQHHTHKAFIGYSASEIKAKYTSKSGRVRDYSLAQDEYGITWVVEREDLFGRRAPTYRPERTAFIVARNRSSVFDAVRRCEKGSVSYIHIDCMWTSDQLTDPGPAWRLEGTFSSSRHYAPGVYVEVGDDGRVGHSGMSGEPTASQVNSAMKRLANTVGHAGSLAVRRWTADPALDPTAVSVPWDAVDFDLPRHVERTIPRVDLWGEEWSRGGYPVEGTPYSSPDWLP